MCTYNDIFYFPYSSINRYLGYFHFLAIANSAAMNMAVQISFKLVSSFPLDIFPGVELLDHMVVLSLIF